MEVKAHSIYFSIQFINCDILHKPHREISVRTPVLAPELEVSLIDAIAIYTVSVDYNNLLRGHHVFVCRHNHWVQ